MAFDAQPRWSPDGKSIVFTSDRDGGDNVWTMDVATKRTREITRGKTSRYRSPAWTPDGQYVVFQFDTQFESKRAAIETVTPMLDTDGQWRVSGYFVR